jgi:hypothetical protein
MAAAFQGLCVRDFGEAGDANNYFSYITSGNLSAYNSPAILIIYKPLAFWDNLMLFRILATSIPFMFFSLVFHYKKRDDLAILVLVISSFFVLQQAYAECLALMFISFALLYLEDWITLVFAGIAAFSHRFGIALAALFLIPPVLEKYAAKWHGILYWTCLLLVMAYPFLTEYQFPQISTTESSLFSWYAITLPVFLYFSSGNKSAWPYLILIAILALSASPSIQFPIINRGIEVGYRLLALFPLACLLAMAKNGSLGEIRFLNLAILGGMANLAWELAILAFGLNGYLMAGSLLIGLIIIAFQFLRYTDIIMAKAREENVSWKNISW